MRIVNPTYGQRSSASTLDDVEQVQGAAPDWSELSIGLLSNAKPNANELLQGIANRLVSSHVVAGSELVAKPNSATPAPPDTIDYLAQRYQLVLAGTGD